MYETGDIVVWDGWPGHVGMVYKGGNSETTSVIHARSGKNFYIEPNQQNQSGYISYLLEFECAVFRPPLNNRADKLAKQNTLIAYADLIRQTAVYGLYRAFRLAISSSHFGPLAQARLNKYQQRLAGPANGKFVTTVTCSEAIILCYQLTFSQADKCFIKLDAAHAMPRTLAEWLVKNDWATVG